jgi:hypothetical protein
MSRTSRHLARVLGGALALSLALGTQAPTAASADEPTGAAAAATPLTVLGLETNARVDPIGIPGDAPSLSWHSTSPGRGAVQTAYQVRVAHTVGDLDGSPLWDSGKRSSDQQVDVVYGGGDLEPGTRYVWQVRVWNGTDEASAWSDTASFETGLLTSGDWGSAEWVGAAPGAELNRWTDYTAEFDFTMDNLVFAPYVRASDTSNGFMWQLSVADGTPRFRPHVKTNGGFALMDNKDISQFTTVEQLLTGSHTMAVTFDGSTITTKLDGVTIDTRTDARHPKGYVGFRSVNATEGVEASTVHGVTVTAKDGATLLDTDFSDGNPFSGGALVAGGLEVKGNQDIIWRSPDGNMPMLRTDFATTSGKTVTSARVYATARGIYELTLNGEKVGDQHLAPGWTDYLDRFQSQTYDVTDLVASGENTFGAELGSGWWAGRIAHLSTGNYGTETSLLARLRITYSDGTTQWIDTDDATWTTATGGYTLADLIDGETYDARLAKVGWNEPGYDDAAWTPAVTRTAPAAPVVPQPDEPVRTSEELATVARTEPAPGRWTYDLGQNMVGVARMELTGEAGKTVTIRYGEELNPDGTLYTANMRSAKVTDRYTFATTGTVTYTPRFTQHGFRYLEIVGTSTPPAAADVTGVVWGSDLARTGDLQTSDPMLNQLISNISWGQRGNFLSIPTDTPARDERLGWSGDINVFVPTASYLTDTRAFLSKWMMDMRDTQDANGDYQGVAPTPPNFKAGTGTGWSDAGITVPYAHWASYGDISTARRYWADMKKFHDLLRASAGADLLEQGRNTWGDWLNLDDPTPGGVLGTASYALTTRMMAEMAEALGDDAYAAELTELDEGIRAAFASAYISADGTVQGNSQTGYAVALGMGLVPDEMVAEVGAKYVAKLAASGNALTTGFLGTPWLLPALSAIDREDLAWVLLTRTDYPSWGYEVEKGATTMWERWNSIMPDGSFGDVSMNSFNHYAYGAVGDWMYQNLGAIKAVEPGYRKIRVEPAPGGGVTHGAGRLDSVYGEIATDWKLQGDDLSLSVEVPVGTTADVVLPAANTAAVLEGGALLGDVEGVQDVVDDGDTVTVTVGSGAYDFDVVPGNAALGTLVENIDALRAHVADLADSGDLTAGDADELDGGLAAVGDRVGEALLSAVDGDRAAVTARLRSALAELRDLRTWLAGSGVTVPVKASLDGSLAALEGGLVRAITSAIGVTLSLPPVDGAVLPGGTISGTVDVTNDGTVALTGLSGTVAVDGLGSGDVQAGSVPPGASVQLPVSVEVPTDQAPGAYDTELSLTYTAGDETYTVTASTADWATVTSGLEVGDLTTVVDGDDPSEHATVTVPVTNTGTADVRAHARLTLPAGWKSVPSTDVLVKAGGQAGLEVPVIVPLDLVGGSVPVTAVVVRGGDELASSDASITVDLPRPPTAAVVDHVDLGDSTSENAHGLQASSSSGTSTEAGLTRRYSHSAFPGSWFSVAVDVPEGKPFLLRGVETFDKAVTKDYDVYVDDVLVHTQLVPRTEGGQGIKVYDALIDHPSLADNDGNVRIRFEFPADGSSQGDPSIADLWVLAVPDDAQAPDVTATIASGKQGNGGWYRSDVRVQLDAADNRDAAPVTQIGTDSGWQDYVAPVTVSGEGRHTVSYRATDSAGNATGTRTIEVGIDATAPTTQLGVTTSDGAQGDRASVVFTATDAVSGVAATRYRVDGGTWRVAGAEPVVVEGVGDHTVDYSSTDVAGNAEVVRQAVLTLKPAPTTPPTPEQPETITSVLAPQVSGTVAVGSLLKATAGTWSTNGLSHTYQWLRDGAPIAATGSSYRVRLGDVGKRLSVRVTATKQSLAPAAATSAATAPVAKARSSVKAKVGKTRVEAGTRVTVNAKVKATGKVAATGKVRIVVDGKVVRTVRLKRGKVTTSIVVAKGKHRVVVRYLGSKAVARSASAKQVVRGT